MKILAIETSCDDTGISIIKTPQNKGGCFDVLSNIISSQIKVHKKYGGVYPMLAKREHQKNLVPALEKALKKAKLLKIFNFQFSITNFQKIKDILEREEKLYKKLEKFLKTHQKPDIDLISVTIGPGLEPCLWVGINFAKALSYYWNIPVIPVNHIESHILVNFLNQHLVRFPAVCLVVSGGHTQLILMKKIGDYKIIGETRDDAAGECFDKAAKILGLGYPGGAIISKLASKVLRRMTSQYLPRPMINTKDYDFSFSGLKTAILYHHKKQPVKTQRSKKYIIEMCSEIQQAVIDVLIKKTIKAGKDYNVKAIILGGGVSANEELRRQLKQKIQKEIPDTKCLIPDTILSTDNALMTAITGFYHQKETKNWRDIKANGNLRI